MHESEGPTKNSLRHGLRIIMVELELLYDQKIVSSTPSRLALIYFLLEYNTFVSFNMWTLCHPAHSVCA